MRVVEQQPVPAVALAVPAHGPHELGIVPFVDEHEAGAVERVVEVELGQVVARAGELRKGRGELLFGRVTMLGDQVRPAPRVDGLVHGDLVAAVQ